MAKKKLDPSLFEYVGSFGVDSGQAMVGDPCYLDDWSTDDGKDWNPDGHAGEYSYQGACNATLSDKQAGVLGFSSAVVFATGYGDGIYPVYVLKNSEGRIVKVLIDFDE